MTDLPIDLVERYRSLPFPSDHLGDCAENYLKPHILSELYGHANDQLVSQLLHDILPTNDEYDLARVKAAEIVGLYANESSPIETQLKRQIWSVFSDTTDDELVRQHAAQHICAGFGGDEELSVIERILFDDNDDLDVRHCAFSYLKNTPNIEFLNRILPKLKDHLEWSKYVTELVKH